MKFRIVSEDEVTDSRLRGIVRSCAALRARRMENVPCSWCAGSKED